MNNLAVYEIEQFVGESPGEYAPKSSIVHALPCRMHFQLSQGVLNCQQKFIPQSGPLPVIPSACIPNVGLREKMDMDSPDQDAFRSRMSARTSLHGNPAPGLRA